MGPESSSPGRSVDRFKRPPGAKTFRTASAPPALVPPTAAVATPWKTGPLRDGGRKWNGPATASTHRTAESTGNFWTRDFLLALFGYFFLFTSVTLFYIFPLRLETLGAPRSRIGLIMGIHSVTAIGVRLVFGRSIDRRGGRVISICGILFFMAVVPFFHFVRDAGPLPFVLRALSGAAWGVSMTASMAVCSDLAPVERLARSIGVIGVAGIVASAVGPGMAEEIVRRSGFGGLYNASLMFLAASLGCLLLTRAVPAPNGVEVKGASAPLRAYPFGVLLIVAAMPACHGAIRGSVINFITLFSKTEGLGRIGPFFAAFSAAAVLSRFLTSDLSDRYGRKAVVLPSAAFIGMNLLWISKVRSGTMFLLSAFMAGFGQGLIFPALSTYIIDLVGVTRKGFGLSLYHALFDMGMGMGSPFFGWISDRSGYRNMYVVAGILLIVSTAIFAWKAPREPGGEERHRRGGRLPEEPADRLESEG